MSAKAVAQATGSKKISLIVPTFKEADNIERLVTSIAEHLHDYSYDILLVDDDSADGSVEIVRSLGSRGFSVDILVRTGKRDLAQAVVAGFRRVAGDILVVMDADLSHPPSFLPQLINPLIKDEADFCLGSRYLESSTIDEKWQLRRLIFSKVATLSCRGLALGQVKDPLSGFFALRRRDLPPFSLLDPRGYKVGLEIMVKGRFHRKRLREIPIDFADRTCGESKLSLRVQFDSFRHLYLLYCFRFHYIAEMTMFAAVGSVGIALDYFVYFFAQQAADIDHIKARALSFAMAVSSNWMLNRSITFTASPRQNPLLQWTYFGATSLAGFIANFGTYSLLTLNVPYFTYSYNKAFFIGIGVGFTFNYLLARSFVFAPSSAINARHQTKALRKKRKNRGDIQI